MNAPCYQKMLLAHLFLLTIFFPASSKSAEVMTNNQAYLKALLLIQSCDLNGLEVLLQAKTNEIIIGMHESWNPTSSVFRAAIHGRCVSALPLLAEYGVELEDGDVLDYNLKNLVPYEEVILFQQSSSYSSSWEEKVSVSTATAQKLLDYGYIRVEDLWSIAIKTGDRELWQWIRDRGADINYRIPTIGYFSTSTYISVIAYCTYMHQFEFIEELLNAGVNVNSECGDHFENLWAYAVMANLSHGNLMERIIEDTENIFSALNVPFAKAGEYLLMGIDAMLSGAVRLRAAELKLKEELVLKRLRYVNLYDLGKKLPDTVKALHEVFDENSQVHKSVLKRIEPTIIAIEKENEAREAELRRKWSVYAKI